MSDLFIKRPLTGVIFDMDGLMFDSERIVKLSWDIAGNTFGYKNFGDNIFHTLGMNAARRKEYFFQTYGPSFPIDAFLTITRKEFQKEVEENGLPMKTGLLELLTYLKDNHIPAAVATSSSRDYALDNLKRAGISSYFEGLLSGNMVTHGKPHPEIYEKACALIHQEPGTCIALEDSAHGIRSAHQAGLIPIMVPDLIDAPDELVPLLEIKLPSLLSVLAYIDTHFYNPNK